AAEHQPKIFYTYSDTEYWERSVALTHTTPDGSKDIVPPSNVRLYHFASSSHNIGRFPPAVTNGETQDNPFDYRLSMRALMLAMENWLRDGTAPPPSRYPRLQDGTLVRATDVAFPNLQGVTSPRTGYAGVRGPNRLLSRDGVSTSLPYLVPQVDRDGNAVGGLSSLCRSQPTPVGAFATRESAALNSSFRSLAPTFRSPRRKPNANETATRALRFRSAINHAISI